MRKQAQSAKLKTQKLGGFLEQILERKREEFSYVIPTEVRHFSEVSPLVGEGSHTNLSISSGEIDSSTSPSTSSGSARNDKFIKAITASKNIAIIGELKFASPSAGVLCSPHKFNKLVRDYEKAGVNAISVITEQHFFHGKTEFVQRVKKSTALPVLQKDFVIDIRQIFEAQQVGSDALLLIARIVDAKTLKLFVDICLAVGIEPVVEVNTATDLKKALQTGTRVIAVNARDLETFHVDVKKACRLLQKIPVGYVKLGFSGITSPKEAALYTKAGAQGILIGTALIKAPPSSRLRRAREVNVDAFLSSLRKQTR